MKTPTKQLKERSGVGKRRLSAYLKAFQSTSVDMFLMLPAKYLLMTHFQMKKKKESSTAHLLSKGILKARQPDLQACISKKKYEEIVSQAQE